MIEEFKNIVKEHGYNAYIQKVVSEYYYNNIVLYPIYNGETVRSKKYFEDLRNKEQLKKELFWKLKNVAERVVC